MNNPLISIIIPVYKAEERIDICINSILNQSYDNLEIILVDDGSPDRCGEICDEYAKRDNRIKVIHKENGGQGSARNKGLKIANGEFISFVDSDDFIHKDYIKYMYELILKYNCDIVQTEYIKGTDCVFPEVKTSEKIDILENNSWADGFKYNVSACTKLYKSECVSDIYFQENLINEDDGTYYKFAYNKKICISNIPLYYYFLSSNSTMRNDNIKMDFLSIYDERIEFFKEKNDMRLLGKSYVRYAVVLFLYYSSFLKKNATKVQLNILWDKYKKIYPYAIKSAKGKIWLMIFSFRYLHSILGKFIGLVRKC